MCNLGMVTAKLTDTAFHCIAMSVVVLNLRKLMLSLPHFLKQQFLYFGFFGFSIIQQTLYKDETLNLYFKIIRNKLSKIFGSSEPNKPYHNKLLSIRTDIYNNLWIKHSVKNLANEINISESYFQHLYKKYFGVSPIADKINSRVEYSKQLLSSSNYSVKEISDMLNYSSDTQYVKQFKLITNMTPSEYRKALSRKIK